MLTGGISRQGNGGQDRSAHVIVCGNEKGGSGKSTTAVHIAVALMRSGFRVASADLDSRQLTMTRYWENRRSWARRNGLDLVVTDHFHVTLQLGESIFESRNAEELAFMDRLAGVEATHDFIVVDTPGADTHLSRLAHRMADTLVTPMNDSFIDFDVLGRLDPETGELAELSQYALAVREARELRLAAGKPVADWVVVRNRMSPLRSRNEVRVDAGLRKIAAELGFRMTDGIAERLIFRELFPVGLTALDELKESVFGVKPTLSHLTARNEIRQLVSALRLPVDEAGRRRAEMRKHYADHAAKTFDIPDIFAH